MGEESPCQGLKEAPEREGLKVLGFKGRVKLFNQSIHIDAEKELNF